MKPGPRTATQLRRLGNEWKQGEHILLSGATGAGKTTLARYIVEERVKREGFVCVLIFKPIDDPTILREYQGWTRWKSWKRNPSSWERRVLVWPDVSKAKGDTKSILEIQHGVFSKTFAGLNHKGRWTVQVDDGLYLTDPEFLNMSRQLAMAHAIGRSGDLTMVTLTQRPSHLPLILYGSAAHAMVGRTREAVDQKRLAALGSREGSKDLSQRIAEQGRRDFLWVPVAPDWPAEPMNLVR